MARKKIQGITIEIGGDTTKLQTALKGVEGKLKDTQDALRDTQRLLKLDPGNVELLTQKQRQLTDAIGGTEEKLRILKDAAKDAEKQLADGSMSQAQFDALQREIVDTEQKLESLKGEMKDFGSVTAQQLKAAGGKVMGVGDKIVKAGAGLTTYVTGPIVAAGAASVAAWNEVDEGLDIIIKKTGATGDALTDMQDRAKNLATSIPTDFATAGAAIGEVNTRFGLTGDALEKLSGQFIRFADLNDTDVSSAIDNTQAVMAAFNVSADRAGDVLDIINKAAQDTGVDVNKLTGDLVSNAEALRTLGFRVSGATGFLANLNKNGLDSGTVMTGLKKALQNATKEGLTMRQALQRIQGSIAGAKTETQALQIATDLFGAKAAPAMVRAIKEGRISFDEMANSVQQAGDSVNRTFEETLDPLDETKTALNELKIVGSDLVEAAAPMIVDVLKAVRDVVKDLRDAFESLTPEQQQMIIKLALLAAAVGPVLMLIGKVVIAVGLLMTLAPKLIAAFAAVKGAIAGIGVAAAANPIGLIIAAVAAVIAILATLWTKCEGFRNFVIGLGQSIAQTFVTMKDMVISDVKAIGDFIAQLAGKIAEIFTTLKDNVVNIWNSIVNFLKTTWQNVISTGQRLWSGFTGWLGSMWDGAKAKVVSVWTGIKNFFANIIEKIKSFFRFEWALPKIKLPHFSIQGSFSLVPPRIPRISVDWYKKAMDNGMILTSPTIMPAANGSLRGFGDAGPEAVVGVSSLRGMVMDAVASALPRGGAARSLTVILELDKTELARTVYRLNNEETQRTGVKLARG